MKLVVIITLSLFILELEVGRDLALEVGLDAELEVVLDLEVEIDLNLALETWNWKLNRKSPVTLTLTLTIYYHLVFSDLSCHPRRNLVVTTSVSFSFFDLVLALCLFSGGFLGDGGGSGSRTTRRVF